MSSKTTTTTVWINGSEGRMGSEIRKLLASKTDEYIYIGGSDVNSAFTEALTTSAKLIFDFSSIAGNNALLSWLKQQKIRDKSILIGTTGLSSEIKNEWQSWATQSDSRVLITSNTSLGVLMLSKILKDVSSTLASHGFDIEIIEAHHRDKVDAPSGTAKLLADSMLRSLPDYEISTDRNHKRTTKEIGIQAIRGGRVFGEHEVRFLGDDEEITFSHRALSRSLFAKGAVFLGSWLLKQNIGCYSTFDINV